MNVIVSPYQTLFDIAISQLGDFDAALDLSVANDVSLSQTLNQGKVISFDNNLKNSSVVRFFNTSKLTPATGIDFSNRTPVVGGISYMGINLNFIVS